MNAGTDNTNRHFKGQHRSEVVSCFCRKHWIVLIKDFAGFIVLLSLLILTGIYFKGIYNFFSQDSILLNIAAIIVAGVFTFFLHKFFLRIIRYFLEIVIITNFRVVVLYKSLYLKDSKDATDLPKVQDIQKRQNGILRNFLKYGDLELTLSSSSTTKVLHNIPNPDYHFRKMNQLKSEHLRGSLLRNRKNLKNAKIENKDHPFIEPTFEGSRT